MLAPIPDDRHALLRRLRKLQMRWERRMIYLTQQGRGLWARGVLFGIETARHRIAEDRTRSLASLNPILEQWEYIGAEDNASSAAESTKGIDFGISLVIRRVRRYMAEVSNENRRSA